MSKKKVNLFEFEYEYNTLGTDQIILDKNYVYAKSGTTEYQDRILISKRKIVISGSRTRKDGLLACLKRTNTPIYKELFRAVIFAYVSQGSAFHKGNCQLDIDGEVYRENIFGEIQDICHRNLDTFMILPVEIAERIFERSDWAKALLISLSEYVLVHNMDYADYEVQLFETWKAFNSVYTYYYSTVKASGERTTEHEQLKSIDNFIKCNFSGSELSVIDTATIADKILDFHVKKFLLNKKTSGKTDSKKLKYVKECILSCNDRRLLNIYMNILDGDAQQKFSFPSSEKQEIDIHNANITTDSDKDLLCFTIIEYGYFIRCKHFHGESGTPSFLVKDNPETEEIKIIVVTLKKLLADLYKIMG